MQPSVLQPLLFSLSKTAFECSKTGLEYLNLLVIQKPANANHFLSSKGWQRWFVDLLMGHDSGSKQAAVWRCLSPFFRAHPPLECCLCLQPQDKDVILKLSLNVIACIHYQHFATHQSSEEIDPNKQDPVPNMAALLMGTIIPCRASRPLFLTACFVWPPVHRVDRFAGGHGGLELGNAAHGA